MNTDAFEEYKTLLGKLELLKSDSTALAPALSSLADDLREGRLGRLKETADRILMLEKNFHTCRQEALALPGASPAASDADMPTSIGEVESLIRSFHIRMQQDALRILDDVQAMAHKDNSDFQPLKSCQAKAKALQQAILEVELPGLHSDVPALLGGIHPFSEFLLLVHQHRNLDEERIEELEDRLQNSFGRQLFLAIVRDKLEFSTPPASHPPQTPSPSEKEPVVKKKADEIQSSRGPSSSVQKKTGAFEDIPARKSQSAPEFPSAETILQQPSTGRRDPALKPAPKKDKADESKNYLLKEISQTRVKLDRALKYGFIQRSEHERLSAIIKEAEALLEESTDLTDIQESLQAVRTALDEQEESAVEGRRMAMREEFQQIKKS